MSLWLVETLIASTLLMALVLMLRRPVARWLGAGPAYWLWALPIARMALPTLPHDVALPSPLHRVVDQAGLPDLLTVTISKQPAISAPSFPWIETAIALWLLGALLFLGLHITLYVRFRQRMLSGATPWGREGGIDLIASPHVSGPLAFGILRRYVVVPADFALRYDPLEQEMAMAHERAHHEHGDLIANFVALLLLALHWCNPVAWVAYRAYRADQETACDGRVLALYGRDQAHVYGRALLKAAGGRSFAAACHLTRIATLKGRLLMLSSHETSLRRITLGMGLVAIMIASGLALTASGGRAAQQMAAITDRVESADFARLGNLVAQPAKATEPWAPAQLATTDVAIAAQPEPTEPTLVSPPITPAADMIAPVAPVPPVPPMSARSIPTEADIARMVPIVDVRDGCDAQGKASEQTSIRADGRKLIRVRICQQEIDRAVRAADRVAWQADREARIADRQVARADRAERTADAAALRGLRTARMQIARNSSMPASARAEALREIDRDIADMQSGVD